jgi:hypothetical protein
MKYIKKYENENYFRLIDDSFWFIKDINTFRKFNYEIILNYKHEKRLREIFDNLYNNNKNRNIYGIILYFMFDFDNISYFTLQHKEDFDLKKRLLISNGYEYRGEIYIKPGRVLVDTIDVDIEKYNL